MVKASWFSAAAYGISPSYFWDGEVPFPAVSCFPMISQKADENRRASRYAEQAVAPSIQKSTGVM